MNVKQEQVRNECCSSDCTYKDYNVGGCWGEVGEVDEATWEDDQGNSDSSWVHACTGHSGSYEEGLYIPEPIGLKIAIVGSRGFAYPNAVTKFVKNEFQPSWVVVSGGAQGPDSIAADKATDLGVTVIVHLPNWATLGKIAGFARNSLIVADADIVVAFWDGQSRGTNDTITKARKAGKPVWVVQDAFYYPHADEMAKAYWKSQTQK